MLGCALSVAAVHLQLISRIPWYEDAYHLDFWPAVFFSLSGVAAALLVLPWAVFHMRDRAHLPANPLIWLGLGLWFGVSTAFVTGGLSPMTRVFLAVAEKRMTLGEMPSFMLDAVLIGFKDFFVQGAIAVPGGLIAGAIFAVGGFAIDRLNASSDDRISTFAPWIAATVISTAVLLFALAGPPETIRDISR